MASIEVMDAALLYLFDNLPAILEEERRELEDREGVDDAVPTEPGT